MNKKNSFIDLLNFFLLTTFSLILLTISWLLISNNETEFKEIKERHLSFIKNEKAKVLILNPKTIEIIDSLCNSPIEEIEKSIYTEQLKNYLKDFNFEISIKCLNKEKYKIKNNCEKKVKKEIITFPDYEIELFICNPN